MRAAINKASSMKVRLEGSREDILEISKRLEQSFSATTKITTRCRRSKLVAEVPQKHAKAALLLILDKKSALYASDSGLS